MRVAAFDLASTMGVAIGAPRGRPEWHTASLGTGSRGERFARIHRLVVDIVRQRFVTEIVVEAPLLIMGNMAAAASVRFLVGAAAVAEAAAAEAGVGYSEIEVRTVRKHFLGCAPKRDRAKKLVMDRCRLLGWRVDTDHEADALALLDCRLAQLSADHGAAGAAIFSGACP